MENRLIREWTFHFERQQHLKPTFPCHLNTTEYKFVWKLAFDVETLSAKKLSKYVSLFIYDALGGDGRLNPAGVILNAGYGMKRIHSRVKRIALTSTQPSS